ncbi:PD-(D/E)XK nuclease family protein [uncultured Selenomonas sp.]|uniref:PD-(D/E)XK nuclease family protein n=1 Tax=uncultured Selenomonas sp. TaxID=159275 RepID=UPI0028E9D4FC|nr:PD-(D/E)XK nuclease family protein [uncultured Selenomonas sp.]
MSTKLSSNNLFAYATSELSQDAFICWLMSHLLEENVDKNHTLTACARDLLGCFGCHLEPNEYLLRVDKQVYNIDVLLTAPGTYVIVEDKTFTNAHDNQINRYREHIQKQIDSGVLSPGKILCVYYKIVDQAVLEKSADVNLFRSDILAVLRPAHKCVNNPIFTDYIDYLEFIEARTQAYMELPLDRWDAYAYQGFFMEIQKDPKRFNLSSPVSGWGYVPNQSGGFWGLWWEIDLTNEDFEHAGLTFDKIDNVYLQIENNLLTVKLSVIESKHDMKVARDIRWGIYNYLHEHIGKDFYKGTFRPGTYMTVGAMEYDSISDCKEKIKLLESTIHNMFSEVHF